MCQNNYGCYQGICTAYYTVDGLQQVDTCTENENYLCKSGACRNVGGSNYCLQSSKSAAALPISCIFDDDCTVNEAVGSDSNYTTYCTCGFNGFGFASCGLAPGDTIYVNYTSAMSYWLSSTNVTNCHTTRRSDLGCIRNFWSYENFTTLAYYQAYTTLYAQTVYNDDCVKNVFQAYFWGLQNQFNSIQEKNNSRKSVAQVLIAMLTIFYI